MRFLRKASNLAKNCQNQASHNFSTKGPNLKRRALTKYHEKSRRLLLLLFSHKTLIRKKMPYKLAYFLLKNSLNQNPYRIGIS